MTITIILIALLVLTFLPVITYKPETLEQKAKNLAEWQEKMKPIHESHQKLKDEGHWDYEYESPQEFGGF